MLQTLVSKKLFAALVVAQDKEIAACDIQKDSTNIALSVLKLQDYMIGNTLTVPTMDDDDSTYVRVLSVVGFTHLKDLPVPMGSPQCTTRLYVEDPSYVGERAVVLECAHNESYWVQLLK